MKTSVLLKSKKILKQSILLGALLFSFHTISLSNLPPLETLRCYSNKDRESPKSCNNTKKHPPKIAAILSVVIPGAGQIYNKKYWKTPLVWGSGLALYSWWEYSNTTFHRCKLASEQFSEEDVSKIYNPQIKQLIEIGSWDASTLSSQKDYYRRHRDLAITFGALLYAANIIDALVDAYLIHYDIGKDISLQITPDLFSSYTSEGRKPIYGVNLTVQLLL